MKTSLLCGLLTLWFGAVLFAQTPGPSTSAPATADTSQCGPFPKLYKEIIWNWMKTNLVDADSAKIEWDAAPACTDLGKNGDHVYGWLVNFKVNARNQFGAYTGKQGHGALIRDGQVIKGIGFGY